MNNSNLIKIGNDIDCTNIVIVENCPLEKCGCLNGSGKIEVRSIVMFAGVKESHIDKNGILQIVGSAIVNPS